MAWRTLLRLVMIGLATQQGAAAGTPDAEAAYRALREGRGDAAREALERAVAAEPDAARRLVLLLDLGYLEEAAGRHVEAAAAFARAMEIAPDPRGLTALGYALLAAGDRRGAVAAFERALALAPGDALLLRQLGYLHKAEGRDREADAAFRAAILAELAGDAPDPERLDLLRRERRDLARRRAGAALTLLWRPDRAEEDTLLLGNPVLSRSQGLLEAHAGLPGVAGARAFARLIWRIEDADPTPADGSLQAGIGLSVRPFGGVGPVLAVERLVAIGKATRDDWLARLSWSHGSGLGSGGEGSARPYWSLYGDVALIDPGRPDLQLAGEARLGWQYDFGNATLAPHLMAFALFQDDRFRASGIVEAGPAILLRLPFGGTPLRAPGHALSLRLSYRTRLAGDAAPANGAALSLALEF